MVRDVLTQFGHLTFLPRMLLSIIAGIIVVLIGVGIWCAWRFLKKKKPKGANEGGEDDEAGLVGNEEEVAEEIEAPKEVESQGKIHYKLEYDFTTQELKVTVSKFFYQNKEILRCNTYNVAPRIYG